MCFSVFCVVWWDLLLSFGLVVLNFFCFFQFWEEGRCGRGFRFSGRRFFGEREGRVVFHFLLRDCCCASICGSLVGC